jgi:hypothetical protein
MVLSIALIPDVATANGWSASLSNIQHADHIYQEAPAPIGHFSLAEGLGQAYAFLNRLADFCGLEPCV